MLKKKILNEFNKQINEETYSAYLYWAMSAWFESIHLPGFAHWMRVQAQEEMVHAMKFYNFIIERGGKVELKPLAGPDNQWDSPLAAFQAAYQHECHITGRINGLVDLVVAQKDHAANAMLQWFVTEQVEEEASAEQVVQKLKLMADAPGAIFMLDQQMARRVFTPPPAEGQAAQ